MKIISILILSLLAACDDSEVVSRTADVLQNGSVHASIRCSGIYLLQYLGGCTPVSPAFEYHAQKLQDGACFVSVPVGLPQVTPSYLWTRSDSESDSCSLLSQSVSFSVEAGNLTINSENISGSCGNPPATVLDITSACSGFNMEAFGAE